MRTVNMTDRFQRSALVCIVLASVTPLACTSSSSPSSTPTAPTPTQTATPAAPKPALAAPVAVSPLSGTTVATRASFTVTNAVRTGTLTGTVTYTFEVADNAGFNPLAASGSVQEGAAQTTLALATDLAGGKTYYWRATALSQADGLASSSSETQTITVANSSQAGKIADQQGVVLWPGTQPLGTTGQARLGPGWGVGRQTSFDGVNFLSPPIDALRVLDLLDRGLDPDAALRWMNSNGYGTQAVYYPSVLAIGFPYQYMALVNGAWELVHRVGA
jgi:hypothetical protein